MYALSGHKAKNNPLSNKPKRQRYLASYGSQKKIISPSLKFLPRIGIIFQWLLFQPT